MQLRTSLVDSTAVADTQSNRLVCELNMFQCDGCPALEQIFPSPFTCTEYLYCISILNKQLTSERKIFGEHLIEVVGVTTTHNGNQVRENIEKHRMSAGLNHQSQ